MTKISVPQEERAGGIVATTRDNRAVELLTELVKQMKAMNMQLATMTEDEIKTDKITVEGE